MVSSERASSGLPSMDIGMAPRPMALTSTSPMRRVCMVPDPSSATAYCSGVTPSPPTGRAALAGAVPANLCPVARRPGAVSCKAEDRPRSGPTRSTPTTQQMAVPGRRAGQRLAGTALGVRLAVRALLTVLVVEVPALLLRVEVHRLGLPGGLDEVDAGHLGEQLDGVDEVGYGPGRVELDGLDGFGALGVLQVLVVLHLDESGVLEQLLVGDLGDQLDLEAD